MKKQYLTVEEQFQKTINNEKISRIKDNELREIIQIKTFQITKY